MKRLEYTGSIDFRAVWKLQILLSNHSLPQFLSVTASTWMKKNAENFLHFHLWFMHVFALFCWKQNFKCKKISSLSSVKKLIKNLRPIHTERKNKKKRQRKKDFSAERCFILIFCFSINPHPGLKWKAVRIYRSTGWWPEVIQNEIMHCVWICFRLFSPICERLRLAFFVPFIWILIWRAGALKNSVDFCIKNVLCINVTAVMRIEFPGFVFIFNGAGLCEHLLPPKVFSCWPGWRGVETSNKFLQFKVNSCTGTDKALDWRTKLPFFVRSKSGALDKWRGKKMLFEMLYTHPRAGSSSFC